MVMQYVILEKLDRIIVLLEKLVVASVREAGDGTECPECGEKKKLEDTGYFQDGRPRATCLSCGVSFASGVLQVVNLEKKVTFG
jgi:transposase-like protein